MAEDIKAIAVRVPLEVFGQGRFDVVDEVVAPDARDHGQMPPGVPPGREGLKVIARAVRAAFPDLKATIELQIAEGDLTATRVKYTGTMKGDMWGMPATGKQATWTESHYMRIKDGKAVEHWADIDQLGMLRQLGLAPSPTGAPASR